MKADETKRNIMEQTIRLIRETQGDIERITIRKIAERAGVGVGLINHHFRSKDHLIELCVQTIISEVIYAFRPEACGSVDPVERAKNVAAQVMDFLFAHQEISRVSIVGDMKRPAATDNTMKTILGFGGSLSGGQLTERHKVSAFMMTSVLQQAFLRKDLLRDFLGIDLYDKGKRDAFIYDLVERVARNEISGD